MVIMEEYKKILYNQKARISLPKNLVQRTLLKDLTHYFHADSRINVITGLRRSGKSTLLKTLLSSLPEYIYINFDDERLSQFKAEDFEKLNEMAIEVYGETNNYFFDEIQNIPGFENFVRRLHDEGKKIVLTGSNASLLSVELGTKLTGRYKAFNLYPFSFKEYLQLKKIHYTEEWFYITEKRVQLKKLFDNWFRTGGLPEYLIYKDDNYVKTLYENILYRDIAVRYGIKKTAELRELTHILTSNLSLPFTYNSLKNTLNLSNSDMVKEYISYLSNSHMFYELHRYSDSVKKQLRSSRKIYMADLAFNNIIGFNTSENFGRRLENIVFVHLRQTEKELFYFNENKSECDFVLKTKPGSVSLYQVCHELHSKNKEREIKGLFSAMKYFNKKNGMILTYNQDDTISKDNKDVLVKSLWKYMLE
jgi:predicted AAA+ superfamily ATPase